MGLSSSQSRFLTLSSRLCDLELKAQNIQHQKIRLAEQSTDASKKYMDALDAQTMKFNSVTRGKVEATIESVTMLSNGKYRVVDSKGNIFTKRIVGSEREGNQREEWHLNMPDGKPYPEDENGISTEPEFDASKLTDAVWFLEQLQTGNLIIQELQQDSNGSYQDFSYVSSSIFTTESDTAGLAKAEAEYEYTMAEIQEKDKRFDLDLDNINTEHSAVDTEMNSVKSVVEKNIEKTFQIFS